MPFEPPGHRPLPAGAEPPPVLASPPAAASERSAAEALPWIASPDPTAAAQHLCGRLHPLTLGFAAWDSLKSMLVPIIAVGVFGRSDGEFPRLFWVFLGIPVYAAIVRYLTFRYRVEAGELITRHGLIARHERHIPLTRVQDIRLEQGRLHRVFGVVDAQVETGAGKGPEASLAVLSRIEAERLRQAVFASRPEPSASAASAGPSLAASLCPEPEILRRLRLCELVLEGLTSNRMASGLVVVAVGAGLVNDWVPREQFQQWLQQGSEAMLHWGQQLGSRVWLPITLLAIGTLLASVGISVAGSIVLFHGFTLARRGEDLERRYGLLRQRVSNLSRRRIQVLKIEESLFRRWLRLATIRADTASGGSEEEEGRSGRDVLLPIVRRDELAGLLPRLLPDLESEAGSWQRVSRRAIRRGFVKGAVTVLALTGLWVGLGAWWRAPSWIEIWPLLLLPAVYWLNVISYRPLGYTADRLYFQSRRGWLGRSWHIVPLRNAQAVVVRETPFDRRHGVSRLHLDTAGQTHTGGAPQIANLPREDALALARELARVAAATRYRLR